MKTWECKRCGAVYYTGRRKCGQCGHTVFDEPDLTTSSQRGSRNQDERGYTLDDGTRVSGPRRPPRPEKEDDDRDSLKKEDSGGEEVSGPESPPLLDGLNRGRVYSTGEIAATDDLDREDAVAILSRLAEDGWIEQEDADAWRLPADQSAPE